MNNVILTVDLGFGDAGKGSLVDFLVREHGAHTVVRYNGGAQAGHRVVTPDGREHVFSQFGAGTLAGARTHLSRFMLLEPLAMEAEANHLVELGIAAPFGMLTIDAAALVITPYQRAINRLRELARNDRHGSCGMGIGETMADHLKYGERVLFAGDLDDAEVLRHKLTFLRLVALRKLHDIESVADGLYMEEGARDELDMLLDESWVDWLVENFGRISNSLNIVPGNHLHDILSQPGTVIFEGAQGVLLDEWYGFHPHTTWSTITLANAATLLEEATYGGTVERIGLTRAYSTRHGAGPFVSEDAELTVQIPDAVNGFDDWQEGFRVGWLDLVMLRYAIAVVGSLDSLAVSCLDRLRGQPKLQVCNRYRLDDGKLIDALDVKDELEDLVFQAGLTRLVERAEAVLTEVESFDGLVEMISAETNLPISILSYGPTANDKRVRLVA